MDCNAIIFMCIMLIRFMERKCTVLDRRTRISWTTSSDPDIYEKFKKLSETTRIPASRLLDEALEDLLVKYGKIDKADKKTP